MASKQLVGNDYLMMSFSELVAHEDFDSEVFEFLIKLMGMTNGRVKNIIGLIEKGEHG